jgi:DeoR family transcriptional regulator, fructose operon transcriptional repressor
LSTPDSSEAAAKRAMAAAARQVVVLADSSKIGHESTVSFADLAQVDVVVTDEGISDEDHKALIDADVQVVVA